MKIPSRKIEGEKIFQPVIKNIHAMSEVRRWRLIFCQLSPRQWRWKSDTWEWINAWMQRRSIRCSPLLWGFKLNWMHRLLLTFNSWMLLHSHTNCNVSRSELTFPLLKYHSTNVNNVCPTKSRCAWKMLHWQFNLFQFFYLLCCVFCLSFV